MMECIKPVVGICFLLKRVSIIGYKYKFKLMRCLIINAIITLIFKGLKLRLLTSFVDFRIHGSIMLF